MPRPARLAAATLLALAISAGSGVAGCSVDTDLSGACVDDGRADECKPARSGRCEVRTRLVEDETCEALGFTHACVERAGVGERGETWVRSATDCVR